MSKFSHLIFTERVCDFGFPSALLTIRARNVSEPVAFGALGAARHLPVASVLLAQYWVQLPLDVLRSTMTVALE